MGYAPIDNLNPKTAKWERAWWKCIGWDEVNTDILGIEGGPPTIKSVDQTATASLFVYIEE
jgi:hypothetical protein